MVRICFTEPCECFGGLFVELIYVEPMRFGKFDFRTSCLTLRERRRRKDQVREKE